jgi:hypothetical protein
MNAALCRMSGIAMAVCCIPLSVYGVVTTVNSTGSGDAGAYRDWWSGSYYGVYNQTSPTVGFQYDSSIKYWSLPVMHFPLAGLTLDNFESATLRLFVDTHWGTTQLRYYGAGGGTVQTGDYLNSGTNLSGTPWLGTGWYQWDVSDQIVASITAGHAYAVFGLRPDNYSGGTVHMSESAGLEPNIMVVPEPAGSGLVAALAIGLAVAGWRRRPVGECG